MRRAALFLLLAAPFAAPAPARAQILGKIRDKAEKAAEKVGEAKETADRYGAAVVPITTGQEIEIGRGIAATIAGRYSVVRDSALTRYVDLVGLTVASVDPRPGIAYRFAILDTDEVNAFAAPGGYVFVTRGALALMDDEATLAGVLAHEVGHVNARDVVDEIQSRARTELGLEEARKRIDWSSDELVDRAVGMGSSALFMGLSREDELDADSYGVRTAAAAGYDPHGLERFLKALLAREGNPDVSILEKTHPDTDDRIAAVERSIAALPAGRRTGVTDAARFRAAVPASADSPGR